VVSSPDFPMNVSREFLQGKAPYNLLKAKLPKCVAEMVQKLEGDEKKYEEFYSEFSTSVKMAVRQTTGTLQETYARFLRYPTNLDPKPISLDQYLEKQPEGSKQILILTGLNKKDVENSIFLEGFRDRRVLLMSEAMDEIMLQGFKSYKEMDFQMISAEGVENAVSSEDAAEFSALKEFAAEELKEHVTRVDLSSRFTEVPAALITTKYSNSSAMESIIKSHPGAEKNPLLMMMASSKKIFELNVNNPHVKHLKEKLDAGDKEACKKYIRFLYDTALLSSGFFLDDKRDFIRSLYDIFGEAVSGA